MDGVRTTTWTMERLVVGPLENNCYLVRPQHSRQLLIVDAAAEPERIIAAAGDSDRVVVVTTHSHRDHWAGALGQVVAATGATTCAGSADADAISVPTDRLLHDGAQITVDELVLRVIALRGHTPGSIALALDDPHGPTHLFTGDALFPGGVGKTATRHDFDTLLADVVERIFAVYPDETVVHPGHGEPTTLGRERPHLQQWRDRGW